MCLFDRLAECGLVAHRSRALHAYNKCVARVAASALDNAGPPTALMLKSAAHCIARCGARRRLARTFSCRRSSPSCEHYAPRRGRKCGVSERVMPRAAMPATRARHSASGALQASACDCTPSRHPTMQETGPTRLAQRAVPTPRGTPGAARSPLRTASGPPRGR